MRLHRYMNPAERLTAGSVPVPESGCWLWLGALDADGYGQMQVSPGVRMGPHRFSLSLRLGRPVSDGKFACHKCDTPMCVNPDHLYEGDHQSNSDDKVRRDRQAKGDNAKLRIKGERHHSARLTEKQVIEIRGSPDSGQELAKRYGVSSHAISMIRRGKTWKHLMEKAA